MHKTIVWWAAWGLVVGMGFFGLQEAHRNSLLTVLAFPLLTGAIAAAGIRLKHEYHAAITHAKWALVSAPLFLLGSGYMYAKSHAYGPFAMASVHKAFLDSTFGMSIPEVERALDRKLVSPHGEAGAPEGLRGQIMSLMGEFVPPHETRALEDLKVYSVPCKARFDFVSGRLAEVTVEFEVTERSEAAELVERIQTDMEKEYKRASLPESAPAGSSVYEKEAVRARIQRNPVDSLHRQVVVRLQYLPLLEKMPGPLTVDAKVF